MKKTLLILSTLLVLVARPLPGAEVTKEVDFEIRRLLQLTGAANLGVSIGKSLIGSLKSSTPNVPEEFWLEFEKEIRPEDLIELIVPIYAKHLTLEELRAANTFYATPLGQSLVQKLPVITGDAMQAGQQWGEKIGKRALERLREKGFAPKKA